MQSIGDNIWQLSAPTPGPSLFVLGGVHGNEGAGTAVVHTLREAFDQNQLALASGTLTLGIGNPKTVAANVRFIEGRDLNRYFTDAHLAGQDGSEEERRAIELAQIIRVADVTIDIHSTNKPSVPFIAAKNDVAHERIYRWFATKILLTDPHYILGGEPATTDEYADRVGKIGICVEAGDITNMSMVPRAIKGLQAVMSDMGMLYLPSEIEPQESPRVYMLTEAILLDERGFRWAEGKGERSFESVQAQEIVGYHGDAPVTAKEDGVVVFPKMLEHRAIGKPVGYLARQIDFKIL